MTAALRLGATVLLATAAAADAKDISLAYFMGPSHPMNEAVFTPFAEKLAEVSGGALTVTQFPGGALGASPPGQYALLLEGVTDTVFHLPNYTSQIFPVTTSITTPGICSGAVECTEALWRAKEAIEEEFDAKLLALWANEPQVLFTKDRAIRTLEDMDGVKVRVTSTQEIPFMEALGAAPVSQPASVINQNLSNGVIDAVSIGSSGALSFKLHEPANHMTTNVPSSAAAFTLLMSNDVWDGLSEEERAWVEEASGEWLSMRGAEAYERAGQRGIEVSKESGVEEIRLSDEERARWEEAMRPALDAWLASEVGQGMTGQDVWTLMRGE